MSEKLERKFIHEVKAEAESDGKMRFSGYLAYFDNVDAYGDVIEKGAFRVTLKDARKSGRTIPVLEQHGGGFIGGGSDMTPLGYYENLKEDNEGLFAEGVLFGTGRGKDMHVLLKEAPQGAMGQSIGYKTIKARSPMPAERAKGVERYLEEIYLAEGSIVTFPANSKARVEDVKAASLFWRQIEDHFRKNGFSKASAAKAVYLIKSATPQQEFALFLANYGNIDADRTQDNVSDEKSIDDFDGAEKLLGVFEQAKLDSDIATFKRVLKNFSLDL